MAETLYELLVPEINEASAPLESHLGTSQYLNRLTTLPLSALSSTESESVSHDLQSSHRSLQALSKRSYRSINASYDSLSHLKQSLPQIHTDAAELQRAVPALESGAAKFADKYDRTQENPTLERRKKSMRLGEHVEQLTDILELPTLLASTIAAAAQSGTTTGSASYNNALDLYAYIRRLIRLYPESRLVKSISTQADEAMQTMVSNLVASLRSQTLKLAGAMRLVGLLRRVAPELDHDVGVTKWSSSEGAVGALFLVCRLANLVSTLDALEPLRELIEKEKSAASSAQQAERYLKRYIEVFREQSFAIISMYKSIFPTSMPDPLGEAATPGPQAQSQTQADGDGDDILRMPSALATFPLHLTDMLAETLTMYLPHIQDRSSRDSLLMQVLYCANSLGRLGGDFGMLLALLEEERDPSPNLDERPEWVEVMNKHRIQAGRLELLAIGAGSRGTGKEVTTQG